MLALAVSGIPAGAAYALLGLAVALLYRTTSVINFAVGAIGAFSAFLFARLSAQGGLPVVVGVAVAVLCGALLSGLLGAAIGRWLAGSDVVTRSVVTVAAMLALLGVGTWLYGDNAQLFPMLLAGNEWQAGGVQIQLISLVAIALTAVLAAVLYALLRFTRLGLRIRAMSERAVAAELVGLRVVTTTSLIWALAGAIAAFAVLIAAPTRQSDFGSLVLLVVPALAAWLVSAGRSFAVAAAAGLAIGVAEGAVLYFPAVAPYQELLGFGVGAVALLWQQRGRVWDEAR